MVDFHSHVLPAVDDGAKDVETALEMLAQVGRQGVDTVVATPHFYMGEDSPERFLARRKRSYEALQPHLPAVSPRLLMGAEVLAWEGMSRMDLRPLCIEGTDLLLVEFPFARMPYWLVEEIENVIVRQRLTVMLAHLERYRLWYSTQDIMSLLELPDVVVQLDADSIKDKGLFRRLAKWLPLPEQLVLGSDMHNITDRAPVLDKAMQTLTHHRAGYEWWDCIEYTTEMILPEHSCK